MKKPFVRQECECGHSKLTHNLDNPAIGCCRCACLKYVDKPAVPLVASSAPVDDLQGSVGDFIQLGANLEHELSQHVPTFPRSPAVRDVLEKYLRAAARIGLGGASGDPRRPA